MTSPRWHSRRLRFHSCFDILSSRVHNLLKCMISSLYCCCQVASVMSESVWPYRWQPTRLPRPWDSPGKNTGVGCHFLLQCMKVKSESGVTQSCLTRHDPMGCSPPGSSAHGIFQARVLEWGAIAFFVSSLMHPYKLHSTAMIRDSIVVIPLS